ncbi:hypothetical protein FZEAL_7783 [Fusarium zealandicum]|uniref:Uncharacterized protein n=1 Tax=Fusarium zealandicum TaxID=1053134 RepID=A0A8H4UFR9_9HYPO|nr:hypothetical protein FZEAL_7783 [Fusarium zealandicum]
MPVLGEKVGGPAAVEDEGGETDLEGSVVPGGPRGSEEAEGPEVVFVQTPELIHTVELGIAPPETRDVPVPVPVLAGTGVITTVVVLVARVVNGGTTVELPVGNWGVLADAEDPGTLVRLEVSQVVHGEGAVVLEEIEKLMPEPSVDPSVVELEIGNSGVLVSDSETEVPVGASVKVEFGG